MSKGDLIQLDECTELMKISNDKYRYINSTFKKPTAKLSDHNTDIKIKVGKEFFKAHKDVICSASDYFEAMFSHNMIEKDKDHIELKGISQEGFQSMLEYFYHGHITLVNENVQPCLEAGSFFQVEWLTKCCSNFLMRHIAVDNCLHILNLADTYSLTDLVDEMYSFIGLNAIKLMEEDKVTQLPYNVLLELVSGAHYIDLPEEMVLGLVVDWANHDFKARQDQLKELLPLIKYHLLGPEELDNIPEALLSYDILKDSVKKSREIWQDPHKWSILDSDISGRGGREVMVLISEWNTDQMQMIDLNNPYLHHEPFGLFKMGKIVTSLATLGNFLFSVGGYDSKLAPVNSLLMFDPRLRIWITLAPMTYCRENFPVVALNKKLYALGGMSLSQQPQQSNSQSEDSAQNESQSEDLSAPAPTVCLKSCECYDPEKDLWSSVPSLPHGMYAHSACVLNGTIYVTGGATDNLSDPVPVGYCYSWKLGDESWTRKAPMLSRRQSHAMFSYNNKIYVMGGYTAGDLEDLSLGMVNSLKNEIYDPETDTWSELCETPADFGHIHKTVAVINDVAYLLGGTYSTKHLHEFHLESNELVQGAYCGKDYVQLVQLTMYYPKFIPNDVQQHSPDFVLPPDSVTSDLKLDAEQTSADKAASEI